MKTPELLKLHIKWLNENWGLFEKSLFTSAAILNLEELRNQKEKEIIASLFLDLPTLNEFIVERVWETLSLFSINHVHRPRQGYEDSPYEFRAWLVEVNFKENEVDLLMKTIKCINFLKEPSYTSTLFKRKGFLK